MNPIQQSFDLGDGRNVTIETGKLAKQADGSAVVRVGNTMLLATIVSEPEAGENVDFLPLAVEYKEKYPSTGKFPGGFFKREGRPTESEILTCRLVDRALRPLFPDDYHSNTVVTISLISGDKNVYPDAYACLAASAAIAVSDIPFNGPISEVRVGRKDGQFIINPNIDELPSCDMDMMVAATMENVVMVEGEMKEVSEEEMADAILFAHEAIKTQCAAIKALEADANATEKRTYSHEDSDEELAEKIHNGLYQQYYDIAKRGTADKHQRSADFKAAKDAFLETIDEETLESKAFLVGQYCKKTQKEAVRDMMLKERIRLDGRAQADVRQIWTEVDYLPATHGSAIFTRGETQSLTSITLGGSGDTQKMDGAIIEEESRFLLHYNFPSFSTKEARMSRGTSRREVGHGNLALRALKPMIPEDCPYTVRVVSDILESNGSSSMATVCAGSLALMDAGVNIKKPVSGIAMGLVTKGDSYIVLSDILGDEDHLGDMDFKVTGTTEGITACQMDIKVDGLSKEILIEALNQARDGRLHILGEMSKTLSAPKSDYKDHAPRIEVIKIDKDMIGAVIGPGGKVIQEIQANSGATIFINEEDDYGVVEITAPDKASITMALDTVKGIVAKPEVGEEYEAKVVSIMPYGAFVEFLPGKQGLLHISEVSWKRLESLDGVLSEGDPVKVKLLDIDRQGRYKLSRKVLIPKPQEN